MSQANPFQKPSGYESVTVEDRLYAINKFSYAECADVLAMPNLQKTVYAAAKRRMRHLFESGQTKSIPSDKIPTHVADLENAKYDNVSHLEQPVKTELVTVTLDAQIAMEISRAFAEAKAAAEQAIRKVVICGLLLIEAKSQVKHGQFEEWLNDHCPDITWRTAQRWMETAIAAVNLSGQLPSTDPKAIATLRIGEHSLRQVLELPAESCPPEAMEIQSKIFATVDGKSARQLMFDFKETEPKKKHHPRKPVNADDVIAAENENDTAFVKQVIGDLLNLKDSITLCHVSESVRFELQVCCRAVAAVVDDINGDPAAYAAKLQTANPSNPQPKKNTHARRTAQSNG